MTALIDRLRLFSLREFAVHRGRTLASMTVVAVSAAFLVAVFGITGSMTGSVDQLVTGLAGHASLEVSGVTDSGFPAAVRDDVAAVAGVDSAVPMVQMQAATVRGPILLLGADARVATLDSDLKDAVGNLMGPLLSVPNAVLVGPGVGYRKGDTFQLGSDRVAVAAVLDTGTLAKLDDGHYVVASLGLAQRATGRSGLLDSVLIVTKPGADQAAVRAAVTTAVAGRAVVGEPNLRAVQTGNGVRTLQYMTLMGAAVAFVVAAFLIYTAMTMSITQRRPVISMLRAIGGRRRTIVADLLAEAAVLGLIGGAVGAALGIVMGRIAISGLPIALVQSMQARMHYSLPAYAVPIAILASICTSVAASAVAAHQVYKVSPIEALAPVGASVADQVPGWMRVIAAGGAVFNLAAAILLLTAHLGTIGYSVLALVLFFGAGMALCLSGTGPIVTAAARMAALFGPAGKLAAVTLERAPRRVWATVMTVFMAVAMTVTITGADNDLLNSLRASFAPVADADAYVAASAPDAFPTGPVLPTNLTARIAAVPGVATVTEGQVAFATMGDRKVTLYGLAAGSDSPLYQDLTAPIRADLVAGRGVVLSRDLGRALGVGVGAELTLQTPRGTQRTAVLQLVSFFSAVSGTAGMGLGQMRDWFGRPGSTLLQVDGRPGVDQQQLLAGIRNVTPVGIQVYSGATSLNAVVGVMREGMSVANAIWVIVVLIAAVALLNTLTLSVLERRRELGVLRAMGSSRRFVLRMVLAEAAGIGLVGGILGLLFGIASQYFFDRATPDIMNIDVTFSLSPLVLVFAAAAVGLSLLGSISPAMRAARLQIIDAVSVG